MYDELKCSELLWGGLWMAWGWRGCEAKSDEVVSVHVARTLVGYDELDSSSCFARILVCCCCWHL